MHGPHVLSGGRYPVLRAMAILYVFGAAFSVLATLLTLGWVLVRSGFAWSDRLIMCAGAVAAGFFLVVSMLALSEVLKLFIDIEHNSRMSAAAHMGMAAVPGSTTMVTSSDGVGANGGRMAAFHTLDEETAEVALLRGH